LISSQIELEALTERLGAVDSVSMDTEANSLHSYFERVCLIQVSTASEDALIDPLKGLDLQSFLSTVESKRLVMHGADYDLRLINRIANFDPQHLFDTMIAARLTGSSALGLAALAEKYCGVKLSKASQKANWEIRPLPDQMLEYALNDTRHLLTIAANLEQELRDLGRWEWFQESCERMISAAQIVKVRDDDTAWRITGAAALNPKAQSVLRILWQWRDSEAKAWNRPPFHVMSNSDLLTISRKAASGERFATPRMSSRRRHSFEVVLALALGIPENEWPSPVRGRRKKYSREHMKRFESLRKKRDEQASVHKLEPSVIAPKHALESVSDDLSTPALMNWQRQLLDLPCLSDDETRN